VGLAEPRARRVGGARRRQPGAVVNGRRAARAVSTRARLDGGSASSRRCPAGSCACSSSRATVAPRQGSSWSGDEDGEQLASPKAGRVRTCRSPKACRSRGRCCGDRVMTRNDTE
jgi:hypothetical protein